MINFPHTLPLPDLSKQGRAEEREAEGGEKAAEESLGCSNCTSTLQLIPKQLHKGSTPPGGTRKGASQEQDRRPHAVVRGQRTPPCACSPPCCANPGCTLPYAPVAPTKLTATAEGRSSPFASIPVAASSRANCSPIQSHQQPQFLEVLLDPFKVSDKGCRTAPRRAGREQWWHSAHSSPPHLAGLHPARGTWLCNPRAQAANHSPLKVNLKSFAVQRPTRGNYSKPNQGD